MTNFSMQEIVNKLNQWAYEYYVLDAPTVSDADYDALYDKLQELEKSSGQVLPNSPTRRVGGQPLSKFVQHTHLGRLYSLDKAQGYEQLRAWVDKVVAALGKVEFTVELKYDGLTLNVTYDKGQFVRATTRGNGIVGEDITAQALTINNLPLSIDYDGLVELSGEGIIKLTNLEKYNKAHPDEQMKNARNAVAGAIRNLNPKVTAERHVDAVFYHSSYGELGLNSQSELVDFFKRNKFKTNDLFVTADNFEQIKSIIEQISHDRPTYNFIIDGVVVKVNDFDQRRRLGFTDKFPKWAIAYKFDAEEVTTTLNGVEWQVGRTGKLTPLARLAPVELCGATIAKATLNNYNDIMRKNLTVNSLVFIRRSNDVIPEVLGVASVGNNSKTIEKPTVCPSCGTSLIERGAHLFCPNDDGCRPQIVQRLSHYCSKNACDIVGLSDKTITQLVDKLGVRSITDLYSLTAEQLSTLDGFKDKKINNTLQAIKGSVNVPLPNFIFALGIENIGLVTAKDFAKTFGCIDNLRNATMQQLTTIDEVGEIVASSVVEYFLDEFNLEQIERLKQLGIDPKFEQKTVKGVFAGRVVVLTGSLENYTRSEAGKLIEDNGGTIASGISKAVNLVLVGSDAGSKLDKAKKLNIEIIDENQFVNMLKI